MSPETLSSWSDSLVYGAMAAYAVAMLVLAAEAAARGRAAGPVPVAAGVATGDPAADAVAAGGPPKHELPAPPDRPRRLAAVGSSVGTLATGLLALGVLARGLAAERVPWGNMYEFAITGTLVAAVAYLVAAHRWPEVRALGVWVTAVLLLTLGLAATVLYVPVGPLVPALRSYWLVIHVAAAIAAAGVFTVAMVASALQIVRERAERRDRVRGYVAALPASGWLDTLAYRFTAFGFPVWTFAVIAGAIWAEASWGRYWGWDPKEVWALISWLVYAAYLHARTTAGWRGSKASMVSLAAYATILFNFFGVNMFFVGLHSYGGL